MRTVHLLANAHIDPVWQWGFEEGIGAALATFRSAAMLLERNPGFVFCHNEALLYRWVEEYEPELFARISALVREGRWHIMGGFELQPDCVMTGGEAMVRQILQGRRYFREKFGVAPEIAVNFDSFGHSQGLVQILARSGYKAYIYMRPGEGPNDFVWRGLDGSSVLAHRIDKGYNSALGHAREALEGFLNARKGEELDLFPWGVGNHGGGPSQKDIDDLNAFAREKAGELRVIHSTPEAYFADVRRQKPDLPVVDKGLYSSNVGCYTSVMEVKRLHRQLEGAVISAERLASVAAMNGEMEYPAQQLADAWRTLSFLEFHDVLPGSHTRPVMERMMEYGGRGLDQARWVMDGVFFRMAASEPEAQPGVLPLLALNPHPYPVRAVVECEFMLPDQNWEEGAVTGVYVEQDGREVPSQVIKEDSTIALDWRKRVAVEAELKPLGITRLDCHLRSAQKKPAPRETLDFDNGEISLRISPETGLMDGLCLAGKPVAADGLGAIWAYADNADPWHMDGNAVGQFQFQLERKPGTRPHITEDGAIFTQVEAQLAGDGVEAVLQYRIPNRGFEGLTITPSGKVLASVQSVLDINGETADTAAFTRIVELDPETGDVKMYAYPVDVSQYNSPSDCKIGDIYAVDDTTLLVIEQGKLADGTMQNKVYQVDLSQASDITDVTYNDAYPEYASAEELTDISFMEKEELLDLREYGWTAEKAEGICMADENTIAVINDNDFGIVTVAEDPENEDCDITDYVYDAETGTYSLDSTEASPQISIGENTEPAQIWLLQTASE